MRPSLQVSLTLEGRRCVIVGGDMAAEERATRLLEAKAEVLVIAPQVCEPLARAAKQGRLAHRARPFLEEDLEGCFFVLVCESDPALGERIARAAEARGVLVYLHDRP